MKSQPSPATSHDSGSFVTGFGLGLITGAVGYFMFATDRGESVRESLLEEWHRATATVKENASKDSAKETVTTVKSLLKNWWQKIESEVEVAAESAERVVKESTKKAKKKASEAKKKTKRTFKGV